MDAHEQALIDATKEALTGREILEYSKRDGQVAHMLGRRGTQSHLFGLARFLAENRAQWTQRSLMRGEILAGISRAIHSLSDPDGCLLYKYELTFYSVQELNMIDPPRPPGTQSNAE